MAEPVGTWSCHWHAGKRQELPRNGVRGATNTDKTCARRDTRRHTFGRLQYKSQRACHRKRRRGREEESCRRGRFGRRHLRLTRAAVLLCESGKKNKMHRSAPKQRLCCARCTRQLEVAWHRAFSLPVKHKVTKHGRAVILGTPVVYHIHVSRLSSMKTIKT